MSKANFKVTCPKDCPRRTATCHCTCKLYEAKLRVAEREHKTAEIERGLYYQLEESIKRAVRKRNLRTG